MSNTAIVVALLVGVAVWFAVASRLTAKPWENRGQKGDVGAIGVSPARIGLWVFMAVVTSLFALFLSAYSMRMHHGVGWCHLTVPRIVWLNTIVLVGASVAMHLASSAVASGRRPFAQAALFTAGVLSIGFLAGQVAAWQAIGPTLYYVQGSPAIAFFYVLTIVHGLHLLGGLYVLGRAAHRFAGGAELVDLRQSVSLCATYWHFLLLVWLAVFGVLLYL
ncbi:MAG TPA: cytochrome c oxidase subunit 3 [Vicinamibacterales bacterium]|nr:cytochrome c oxidase subunit 3 [Vicinamibacterales bacterium]